MGSDDQLRDAMAKTMVGFAAVVAALDSEHWDVPSPCTGWSVFDVVDHVVAGERFTAEVLAGASLAEASEAQVGLDSNNKDPTFDRDVYLLSVVEGNFNTRSLLGVLPAGVSDQDSPHREGGDSKEMRSVLYRGPWLLSKREKELVQKRSRLKRMIYPLRPEHT